VQFHHPFADFFVPDHTVHEEALRRTTHMCICAHQDDIEIMAYHGVAECFGRHDRWFTGVVVTNGAGSPRSGIYADYTDAEMQKVRVLEQRKAAFVGEYGCQIQLGFTSSDVKDPKEPAVVTDLGRILEISKPEVVYLHNLADKHDTHVSVSLRALAAMREMPREDRPRKVYGCEVWRDLDWLMDDDKQMLSASSRTNIAASLVGVFDSQVTGGKRYDLATAGRRLANATYFAPHGTDQESALNFAMDLTPLVDHPGLDITTYVVEFVDRFRADVEKRLKDWVG
jgi:LmbE family N-acetylglucosaminyl deacetylase